MIARWTLRRIDGVDQKCLDIGCPDFRRAEENRRIIKEKLYTIAYVLAEEAVRGTPLSKPLPCWVPQEDKLYNSGEGNGEERYDEIEVTVNKPIKPRTMQEEIIEVEGDLTEARVVVV